jgi:PAS domain S-box-containing protein
MRILVVDDTEDNRYLLETLLKGSGYEVVTATNGWEALEKVRSQAFDMIVSDILMPVMDGFQLCGEVKGDDDLKEILFVFYTASYTDDKDEELASRLGADKYIRMPVQPEDLLGIIQRMMGEMEKGKIQLPKTALEEEKDLLRLYSERLVKKLESKIAELEKEVAERKRVEEALRESEGKLRTIFENVNDEIIYLDASGTVIDVNDRVEDIFGYKREELVGRNIAEFDFTGPETRQQLMDDFVRAIGGEVPPLRTYEMVRKDGSTISAELSGRPVQLGREAGSILVIVRDVSERRQAEEAVLRSEEKFRTIFETARDLLVYLDNEGVIIDMNSRSEILLGYKRDEVIGTNFIELDVFEAQDVTKLRNIFDELLRQHRVIDLMELNLRRRDGTVVPVEVSTSPIEKDGMMTGWLSVVRDVSERKKAEATLSRFASELARSNAELEQFAYVASHDLQEPLRMVRSYVQLLDKRYKGKLDSDADEFISYAVGGVDRMQALIEGLLTYSRVSTRGGEFGSVECESVLDRVLANLALAVEDSGAVVTRDPLPQVMADGVQLGRLFQNLIANAIKFQGDEPPRVHVSAREGDKEWVFSVQDNGIGIEPSNAERVFAIFQRLHPQDEYPGTGIGLAVCKRIVERHGGRIWVESDVGHGSTFHFTIPLSGGK